MRSVIFLMRTSDNNRKSKEAKNVKLVKWKACLSVLLVTLLVFSMTTFAATKPGVTYIALGDSIAYGTGAADDEGYTDLFAAHLNRVFGEGDYNNLAEDGMTSDELLYLLTVPGDTKGVQAAVTDADIITISIGGNDLLGTFIQALLGVIMDDYLNPDFSIDFDALLADLAMWELDPTTQPQFNLMIATFAEEIPEIVTNHAENWGMIISIIRTFNPDAEIYVNTVYNPFKFSQLLSAFADEAIQGLNLPITMCAQLYGYHVVDVYSNFEAYNNPKKLIVGDMSTLMQLADPDYTGDVPLHPTDFGYKFIFNLHKDLMD